MTKNNPGIAVNESYNGEEVIPHLVETARALLEVDVDQSKEFFEKALLLSKNIAFFQGMGECNLELGRIQFDKDDVAGAYKYLHEAINCFEKDHNPEKVHAAGVLLSQMCFIAGNYEQALESQLRSLQTARQLKDQALLGDAFNKTGNIYKALKEYDQAISYHQQALKLFEKLGDELKIASTLFYLGNCLNWAGILDESLVNLDKSLAMADKLKASEIQAKAAGSLAILLTKHREFDRAIDFFYKAIDYTNIAGDMILKADLLRNLGKLYNEQKQFELALKVLFEALEITNAQKSSYPKNLIHKSIAEAYEGTGNFKDALNHHKLHYELASSLLNEEVALKAKGIKLRYDVEEAKNEKELAEKAVALKDKFIANISHEIRTPLNDVLGMATLLADTHPTAEQLEYINTIRLSAGNLNNVVSDLLDYSKIQSGEIKIDQQSFDPKSLFAEIAQELRAKATEKKLELNFNYDNQLPELIIGDKLRLKQILIHLLANAVKYTSQGLVRLEVQVTEAGDHDMKLLFAISDTGIGIPESEIDSIFERFTQVRDTSSGQTTGTGLGLALVKQLVDLIGGTISVNSKVGAGSVFKVELPFKLVKPLQKSRGPSKANTSFNALDLSSFHILLVEDNKVNQFLAQKLLTKMGFTVVIANNGKEALEKLNSQDFDIILMDVQMPEMTGYELTQTIRNTLSAPVNNIPIIALTAYASVQEKEKAMALGMSDYITKPYSPHELQTAIMKQMNRGKAEERSREKSLSINQQMVSANTIRLIELFGGNKSDVISLLQMLITQIPALIREAELHITGKNWKSAYHSFHKIKSTVNLLRIDKLVKLIEELEELTRDEFHTGQIPKVFSTFKKSCETAVSLLTEEVSRLKNK